MQVNVISSELLSPTAEMQNPPKFKLTVFDRLMRHVPYQLRVLFYKPIPTTSFEHILHQLKRTLAEVLVIFYPLAGRIIVGDGITSPVLELDCSLGQSIKFTQAVTDATLEQLGCFEPSTFCDSLSGIGSPPPKYPWSSQDPLLFIQLTKFACGGLSLGFAFSHQAVDGVSAWHFMNSWAEMTRTGTVKLSPDITYSYKEMQLTDEQVAQTRSEFMSLMSMSTEPAAPASETPPKLVTRTYTVDRDMIEKLRAEAAAATNGVRFSTFQLISAYFWKRITVARKPPGSTPCSLVVIVNSRGRSPLLSKAYFGNAASGFSLVLKAEEIERSGIGELASLLQGKITKWTIEEADRSVFYFDWVQTNTPQTLGGGGMRAQTVQTIGSPRHPVYETDFGFGKPAGVTFGTNDLGEGKIYLFPTPAGDGSVSATVVLNSEDLERLVKQDGSSEA